MTQPKQTSDDIASSLFSNIHKIVGVVGLERNMTSKTSITITQMRVLAMFNNKKVVHISAISPILGMSVPSVNNVVSRLETGGYVKRKKNTENRRLTDISLTEKGKKSIRAFRSNSVKCLTTVLDKLSKKEVQELSTVLKRAAEILADTR